MTDTEDRWRRVDEIFQAALDLPEAQREDFVLAEAGEDPDLRERGRAEQALPLLEDAGAKAARTLPDTHYRRALIDQQWGTCLATLGRRAEAEAKLLEAHDRFVAGLGVRTDEAAAWRARLSAPDGSGP